jgi:DNA-binding LacI/PurR family transcriptional regulator
MATLLEMRVDGLIILGSMMKVASIERIASTLPVTLVGRHTRSKHLDTVGVDDFAGGQLAVAHLADLGHRRIAHIHAGSAAGAPRRKRGYEKAMKERGLEDHIQLVQGDYTEQGGAKAMTELLHGGTVPTAVFAPNDASALGAMEVIDDAGLRIPDDISLVGFDNLTMAGLHRIALTTVGQPRTDLGKEAVHLVLERLDENRQSARHIIVAPTLVVRSTTGPTPSQPVTHTLEEEQ